MTAIVCHGDARALQLPDESVDLICTSPPYYGLRDYGYTDQLGAEATPQEYVAALVECTREMARVLKPSGSIWINLGDKYNSAASGQNGTTAATGISGGRHDKMPGRGRAIRTTPAKSLMLLPHRFAIACMDELALIVRQDQVWAKMNGLPESVVDRTRRSHEYLFHLTKSPRYFSAVDEIREQYEGKPQRRGGTDHQVGEYAGRNKQTLRKQWDVPMAGTNPLGKLPGSVWSIPTQPLNVPAELGVDHFAAWPMEIPRRLITGWCPREVCTACGEGRRPEVLRELGPDHQGRVGTRHGGDHARLAHKTERKQLDGLSLRTITGYACACPDTASPSTPGIVLDPFGGTGTTALIADILGRIGISVDASTDYCRIAAWRTTDPVERARAAGNDTSRVARVEPTQGDLFAEDAS